MGLGESHNRCNSRLIFCHAYAPVAGDAAPFPLRVRL
jgi:hypothetical protein